MNQGDKVNWLYSLFSLICERELDRIAHALPPALDGLMQVIEQENQNLPQSAQVFLSSELRLIRAVKYVVIPFMRSLIEKHS